MATTTTERSSYGATERARLVRRGLWLNYATIAYNALESVVSVGVDNHFSG
jgi:hypothetical protein